MDINQLKNKINRYEKQFEGVKECMNSKSSDQIISKFEDGH